MIGSSIYEYNGSDPFAGHVSPLSDGRCGTVTSLHSLAEAGTSKPLLLAIRPLVLYTQTDPPGESLAHLVRYIQHIFAPILFLIKSNPCFSKEAIYLFQLRQKHQQQSQVCGYKNIHALIESRQSARKAKNSSTPKTITSRDLALY